MAIVHDITGHKGSGQTQREIESLRMKPMEKEGSDQ
jgi:hypothetical protein